jgi:2-polyprenyl-3-methyl-5-hydroxy-6-metoxy-1,4-benzoquinol methylase
VAGEMGKAHTEYENKGYTEDQREFFDKLITEDWETYISTDWDVARKIEVQEILCRIPLPRKVLDLGCGCGYHDLLFAGTEGIRKVIGVDYSVKSVEAAEREYPHPKVERYAADFFQDKGFIQSKGPYDLVASFQVIEHLSKAKDFIEVSAFFAEEGGHVAIVTPNSERLQNRLLKAMNKPVELVDPLHYREYGVRDLKTLGIAKGLKFMSTFGRGLQLHWRGRNILQGTSRFSAVFTHLFPNWCDVIGVIFQK